jgi:chromate transporter
LFGGAYVFVPLMQDVVVREFAWVTQREFVDAVALGQLTPGPVLVSAAFIGLKVAGFPGAVAATAGIFLPSAVLIVFCTSVFNRIKNSSHWRAIMRGIYPAVTGMIGVAGIAVARTSVPAWPSVLIFLTALIALLRFRTEVVWIVPPAGLLGLLMY